jgi:hypothetical protein
MSMGKIGCYSRSVKRDLAPPGPPDRITAEDASCVRAHSVRLHGEIEAIEAMHTQHRVQAAIAILEKLQKTDPDAVERILARFRTPAGGA